ncbi:V-type proton ATPase subunit e1 [Senna tora]|uniref:V-type proton ATPase subunit e1 n=1 Tax=Senna tora TaxID=362788 RepID=A0A834WB57_9FABA|nr:V-type proton ATPase subunit e1 [Senna tora]
MGFLVTTLIFVVIGIIASLCTRICCNRGPSANLYVSPNFGYHCNNMLLDDVSACLSGILVLWAIVYLAQMNPLIVPILNEGE